jgi:hypothetical protein
MGPLLPVRETADGLEWAHYCQSEKLLMASNGPIVLCFVSDSELLAYFTHMCHRLALSAVSSHVLVSLLIPGSV